MKMKIIILWMLKIAAAIILLQTLLFKFTGSKESVELFTNLVGKDYEAVLRITTGILELMVSILLLIPSTTIIGAILGMGIMAGAIFSHLLVIGIESQGDGGQLFTFAIIVFICCLIISFLTKEQGSRLYKRLLKK